MSLEIGKSYKKFKVLSVHDIPDCASRGIYLRHEQTGLEVFHLLNDDAENLFAFAFRTPIRNSTGAAHIMEHSVFCGSRRFPLKEPFTNMMNQSVSTFLNALTYSDKTVYPASSMNRADYFNLMDVYGDAVFFPLLKKEAFLQEGHRLELGGDGSYAIQGVVYNEMKGNYSSFESVAGDAQLRSLFAGTNYAFDSGGDPLEIPSFSYEDFRAFHKKYYRPENCLVFLYGNIATEEQLDFLQAHFLDDLEKQFPVPQEHERYPFVSEEFVRMETARPIEKPLHVSELAPDTGATGATVTINWLCGDTTDFQSYMECAFLSEVLFGHDGSPVTKALVDSDLGDDLAPLAGTINDSRSFVLSVGLHGVKPRNEKKVYSLILSTLEKLCRNGINPQDVESALMSAEFSSREVVRSGGPYSLVLLDRALNGWNYGRNPGEILFFRAAIEEIRRKLSENSGFVVDLIQKYLLQNQRRSYVMVRPSKKYLKLRTAAEQRLLKKLTDGIDAQKVKDDLALLHAYQSRRESAEEVACIPELDLASLETDVERIETELSAVDAPDGKKITLFTNSESTNGIAYFSVCLPVDVLDAADYAYLPLYSYCATNMGFAGKPWDECAQETAVHTGGLYTRLMTANGSHTADGERLRAELAPLSCTDRDWLVFTVRFIKEEADAALRLLAENLSALSFADTKRLRTLTGEAVSAIKAAVVPKGNRYAAKRVQCVSSHAGAVDEIWNGLTQLFRLHSIAQEKPAALQARFSAIYERLCAAGALLHLTADGETLSTVIPLLPRFVVDAKIVPLCKRTAPDEDALKKMLLLPGETELPLSETFVMDSQVGFAAKSFPASFFGADENPPELVLAHWLSGNLLWERLRTTGGAYGAYAASSNLNGLMTFSTFRDPTPEKSADAFNQCLADFAGITISEEERRRILTGTYGDEVQPHSPSGKGAVGFFRKLYCIADSDRRTKIKRLLSVSSEEMHDAAARILSASQEARTAIIADKDSKNAGIIIDLPL